MGQYLTRYMHTHKRYHTYSTGLHMASCDDEIHHNRSSRYCRDVVKHATQDDSTRNDLSRILTSARLLRRIDSQISNELPNAKLTPSVRRRRRVYPCRFSHNRWRLRLKWAAPTADTPLDHHIAFQRRHPQHPTHIVIAMENLR